MLSGVETEAAVHAGLRWCDATRRLPAVARPPAAIKGNGEACTVLLQGGSACVLSATDVTGSTPAQVSLRGGPNPRG